jgi:hypothetical protein
MNNTQENSRKQISTIVSLIISVLVLGMGVGWLAGLSVAPVVTTLLASVLGIVGGIVSGLSGLGGPIPAEARGQNVRDRFPVRLDSRPAALFVLGVALGTSLGITARTHRWLEPSLKDQIARWESVGQPREEIVKQLMRQATVVAEKSDRADASAGVLFARETEECARLLTLSGSRLQNAMQVSTLPWARRVGDRVQDTGTLKEMVEALCKE